MRKTKKELQAQVAGLESQIDLLEAEIIHLNEMLLGCGFPEGIKTLKETMQEVLAEQSSSDSL